MASSLGLFDIVVLTSLIVPVTSFPLKSSIELEKIALKMKEIVIIREKKKCVYYPLALLSESFTLCLSL